MDISSVATSGPPQRHRVRAAIADLLGGLALWELWSTLGWHDIRQRYRRSIVGPFWLTLSMGVMIGGMSYLYAGLFGQNIETYLPYLATGIIIFALIQTMVAEGAAVFISSASLILQLRAPLSIYVYQMLWRNLLIFLHNISIYVVVLMFAKVEIGWSMVLALFGLLLVAFAGVWVGLTLGALSARFRDVPPIVASVLQVAFFLTPVMWLPEALKGREILMYLNPFYYFLEIVRTPLLGKTPALSLWLIAIGLNVVGGFASLMFFARYRERIAYWV
jgi:ABC-2 type transport system permease protein/lipopolysaccharide transport system permease protein